MVGINFSLQSVLVFFRRTAAWNDMLQSRALKIAEAARDYELS